MIYTGIHMQICTSISDFGSGIFDFGRSWHVAAKIENTCASLQVLFQVCGAYSCYLCIADSKSDFPGFMIDLFFSDTNPWIRRSIVMQPLRPLKWSGSFFLNHNKSFRCHLGDYEKHNLFPFEGLWEEKLWFLWVLRMCSMPGGRVWPGVTASAPSIQLI